MDPKCVRDKRDPTQQPTCCKRDKIKPNEWMQTRPLRKSDKVGPSIELFLSSCDADLTTDQDVNWKKWRMTLVTFSGRIKPECHDVRSQNSTSNMQKPIYLVCTVWTVLVTNKLRITIRNPKLRLKCDQSFEILAAV